MEPNQQAPGISADYLNQIAPTAPKRSRFSRNQFILMGLGAAVVIVLILVAIVSLGGTSNKPLQTLSARLKSTEIIVNDSQKQIKSSTLRGLNSNLSIGLVNANRDITPILEKFKITTKSMDAKIVAAESEKPVLDVLENARLNAVYDRTYAREMAYRISTIISLSEEIKLSTSSQSLREFLTTTIDNFSPTQKALDEFNATNG